jgi:transcriptional regulator with XRE-family HTH domain
MTNIFSHNTDAEVMAIIGRRMREHRLQRNMTVAEAARMAGLTSPTVINVEHGRNPRLGSLVRLLRVLGRLEALDAFLPEPAVSPIQLARLKGRTRQRARKSQREPS